MDAGSVDSLARILSSITTRRGTLVAVLGGPLALLRVEAVGARNKKKKKACPPCKKRNEGKCKGTLPDGTGCPGGTCKGASCIASSSPLPPPPPPPPSCPDPASPNFCPNTGACLVACTGNKVFSPSSCTCQCRAVSCCRCSGASSSFCSEIYTSDAACTNACLAANPGSGTSWSFAGLPGSSATCLGNRCSFTCVP